MSASRWEYHPESYQITERWWGRKADEEMSKFKDLLNRRGAVGWEMIGYESIPMVGGFTGGQKGYMYLLLWKRPIGPETGSDD